MSKNHLSYQNGFTHSPLPLVMPPFNIVMHFTIRFVLKEHGFGHILPQGREFYGDWASWLYRLGSGYVFGITYTYSLSFKNPHWKYHLSILLLLPCFTTMPASFNAPPATFSQGSKSIDATILLSLILLLSFLSLYRLNSISYSSLCCYIGKSPTPG